MVLKEGTLLQDGKYEILRVLGQGGFGITYEAVHVLLGKRVALKEFFMKDLCIRSSGSNSVVIPSVNCIPLVEKFRNKFIKEAQTIVKLEHPHIVKIYDVFRENGTAYYVMDLLLGGSLGEKVKKEGALPEDVAESYLSQIADALAIVHAHNSVHLDVKPSNILLDSQGGAVLIDFGISKHYDDSGEQTSTSPVCFSKGYAPLEQGRDGDVSQFGPSTDIYALGATLFFLLTGKVPPEASIVYEEGMNKPMGVSDRMWRVIDSAMKPRRKERPQSIEAFLSFLESPISNEQQLIQDDAEETQIIQRKVEERIPYIPQYVDLGLPSGIKWASCNLGAGSPEEEGLLFAWGEVSSKKTFNWSSYSFVKTGSSIHNISLSKYWDDSLLALERDDDPATSILGPQWRVPTGSEVRELIKFGRWRWVEKKGTYGYEVLGPNNNSIFLPVSRTDSFGRYWTASRDKRKSIYAKTLSFGPSSVELYEHSRFVGLTIRPIFVPQD